MIPITKKRKVLLATPMDTAADIHYLRSLVPVMRADFPDTEIHGPMISDCGAVNFARNEIAFYAEQQNFDEVVQWDSDMALTPETFGRMLSHDVDFVGHAYCQRKPGKPKWTFVPLEGAEVRPDGLLECIRIGTGLIKTRVSCFKRLREVFPEREYQTQKVVGGPIELKCEFFPMGVVGPRTAEARLKRIMAIATDSSYDDNYSGACSMLGDIRRAATDEQPPGTLLGEDFYFSQMCREAGFQIFADLGAGIIPHIGKCGYPIDVLMAGIGEGLEITMPMAEAV